MEEEYSLKEEIQEQDPRKQLLWRIVRGFVALLVLGGFVYISGIDEYLFYRRTPPLAEQQPIQSQLDAKELRVPLAVFILQSELGRGSVRTRQDAARIVEQAGRIWAQADIALALSDARVLHLKEQELDLFFESPRTFFLQMEEFEPDAISVFFPGSLKGINGIAYGGSRSVAVADYTTVYDFRALAHEIGHILGLRHVDRDRGSLMYQGANGSELSLHEILQAREGAQRMFLQ